MICQIRRAVDLLRRKAEDCIPFSGMEAVAQAERRYEEALNRLRQLEKSLFLVHSIAAMRPCPDELMESRFQSMAEASLQCAVDLRKEASRIMASVYIALGEYHLIQSDPKQCIAFWRRALSLDFQSQLLRDKIAEILQ